MASIIDALVVTLGLDGSKFKAGAEDAKKARKGLDDQLKRADAEQSEREKKLAADQKKRAKDMDDRAKGMADGIKKIRNEALGLFAALTGAMGLKDFVTKTIESEASLSRMSTNLDMSAKDLAMWQLANERAGGSVEGMNSLLKTSADEMAKYRMGKGLSASMVEFGVQGGDLSKLKTAEDWVRARSDLLAKIYAQDKTKAAALAPMLGIDDSTYNLIKQGAAAVDDLRMAQEKLAEAQAKNAPAAEELRKKWNDLKNQATEIAVNILTKFMPALDGVTDGLSMVGDVAGPVLSKVLEGWRLIFEVTRDFGRYLANMIPPAWLDKFGAVVDWFKGGKSSPSAPTATQMQAVPSGASAIKSGDAAAVVKQLMAAGWTQDQAAGIAANLAHESGLKAGAIGDSGKAYGIAQWHPDRQAEFAKKFGKSIRESSLAEQVAFVDYELRQGKERAAGQALMGAKSAADAGDIVSRKYERPLNKDSEAAKRAQSAALLSAQMGAANAAAAARMPSGAGASAPAVGNTSSTNTSSTDVKIGAITVQTQATNADGIARDIGAAIRSNSFIANANAGLN